MTKAAINSLLSKLSDYKDYICIVDDNNRVSRVKSDTYYGYFDDSLEAFVCISKNDNPIRNTVNQGNFMIDFVDYDHITRIYVKLPDKDTIAVSKKFNFDTVPLMKVMTRNKASYSPAGFSYVYDKDGNPKQVDAPLPDYKPGVPVEELKEVHPINDESTENEDSEG